MHLGVDWLSSTIFVLVTVILTVAAAWAFGSGMGRDSEVSVRRRDS